MTIQISRYRVVRELGQGGMAIVYEAVDEQLGRSVALKVLHPPLAAYSIAVERFLREARIAARIRHPHIVDVFDVGMVDGLPYIVMELLEGETLALLLAREKVISASRIGDLFLPVLSAVAAAHEGGLVHRDLKPGNVMLARRRRHLVEPIVLDFGISKLLDEEPDVALTVSGSILGTIHYMAPEQTGGARFASPQSDQYALGVMLYECAVGVRPYEGSSAYDLMHSIMTATPTSPREVDPSVPRELEAIIQRAMHRDPAARFPSVHALGSALLSLGSKKAWVAWSDEFTAKPAGADVGTTTQGDVELSPARAPASRRKSYVSAALSGLLALAAFLLGIGLSMGSRPASPDAGLVVSLPEAPPHATPPADTPLASAEVGAPSPVAEVASSSPSALPATAVVARIPKSRRASTAPVGNSASPMAAASAVAPPSSALESHERAVEFGRNHSPIVE